MGHVSMLVVALFWGLAVVAIKAADQRMSWITLTLLQLSFVDLLFLGYFITHRTGRTLPARSDLLPLLGLGFLGFTGNYLLVNLGESNPGVTAGTAALIIASDPAFIALFAMPILKEKLTRTPAIGIALALAGLTVMILFAHSGSRLSLAFSPGALEIVPPAIFTALYLVLGRKYLQRYSPFLFVAYTIMLGTLLAFPVIAANWLTFVNDLRTMGWEGFVPVLFLAICPTYIAYGLWFRATSLMPAAAAGAYIYLSTLIGVVGGMLLLGEPLTQAMAVGGVMVIGGVVLAQRHGGL